MRVLNSTDLLSKFKESLKMEDFGDVIENFSFWDRTICIGDINADVGDAVEGLIRFWNNIDEAEGLPAEKRTPIKMYIDSDGGDLSATFTIIDSMKLSKTPIITINIGSAYSGGFFIFLNGDKRITYPHSSFLYHEGSAQTGGTSGQFENFSAFYKKQLSQIKDIVLATTNISEELYEEKKREDWWIDVKEALELNIVDEVAEEFV